MGCGGHGTHGWNRGWYRGRHGDHQPVPAREPDATGFGGEDPLIILKRRLARGEITIEEYQKLESVLKG